MNDEIAHKAAIRLAEADLGVSERSLRNRILEPGGEEAYRAFLHKASELNSFQIKRCCSEVLSAFCTWTTDYEKRTKRPTHLGMRMLFKHEPWSLMRQASFVRVLSRQVRSGFLSDDIPTLASPTAKSLARAMCRCFLLETGYDSNIPGGWTSDFTPWDPSNLGVAYLFADDIGTPVGCASFENRLGRKRWMLGWVWFRPEARRKGHLSRRWNQLREIHGDFVLSHPLSDGMRSFLASKDPGAIPEETWT